MSFFRCSVSNAETGDDEVGDITTLLQCEMNSAEQPGWLRKLRRHPREPREGLRANASAIPKADPAFPAPVLPRCHRGCSEPTPRCREYVPLAPRTSESRHPERAREPGNGEQAAHFQQKSCFQERIADC